MKLNLKAKFAVANVRIVPAPELWGDNWYFHIARIGCDDYVAHQRDKWEKSGIQQKYAQASLARGFTSDPAAQNEILIRLAEKGDIKIDLMVDNAGIAKHLIKNIEGLQQEDGSPLAYTPEVGADLLSRTDPVPTGKTSEDGKAEWLPVGQMIRDWVIEEASNAEAYRNQFVEAGAKN